MNIFDASDEVFSALTAVLEGDQEGQKVVATLTPEQLTEASQVDCLRMMNLMEDQSVILARFQQAILNRG